MNDLIYELSSRYARIYSQQEIRLNKALYDACSKKSPDFAKIEQLLKAGADPLGGTASSGPQLFDHVYGELAADSCDSGSIHLPRITELFLKYGMDIDAPRIPYSEQLSMNPLWSFAFAMNENSILALKMLLDHGLSAESAEEMLCHAFFDLLNASCGDPCCDEYWNSVCVWTLKHTMLCASYEHILNNSAYLQELIGLSANAYGPQHFRAWNAFRYEFDTSGCTDKPQLYRSVVKITAIESGKEVWRFCVE